MLVRRYPRSLTAIHEAGHAVVAAALDVHVDEVDIQLRRRPAGPGGAVIEVAGCCHRNRGSQRDEIAIALAGALAETHICKVVPGAGCQNDILEASFIAALLGDDQEVLNAEFFRASKIVTKWSRQIVDLATALVNCRWETLSHTELRALLPDVFGDGAISALRTSFDFLPEDSRR